MFSLLLLFSFGINAQEVVQLLPPSWELDLRQGIDQIVLPATDLTEIRRQDSINDLDKGRPYRYGIERPIRLELGENGTWTRLEDGRRIWRVAVRSVGATNISLNFDRFYLPPGGRLFIYNEDRSDLLASFSDSAGAFLSFLLENQPFLLLLSFSLPALLKPRREVAAATGGGYTPAA